MNVMVQVEKAAAETKLCFCTDRGTNNNI